MRTALVTTVDAQNELGHQYYKGARVMFHTLRKYGNLPKTITPILLGKGIDKCDFAELLDIDIDYSHMNDTKVSYMYKLHAFTLTNFDKVIYIDSDMYAIRDCSYLWSKETDTKHMYACTNPAVKLYFKDAINKLGLPYDLLFGTSSFVCKPNMRFIGRLLNNELKSFGAHEEGILNWYYITQEPENFGWLPAGYSVNMNRHQQWVPEEERYLIHLNGDQQKPWDAVRDCHPDYHPVEFRLPYHERWKEEYEDSIGGISDR